MKRHVMVFTSSECVPCKQLKLQLAALPGIITDVEWVDVEKSPILVHTYSVTHVPTTLLIEEGCVKSSIIGLTHTTSKTIREWLNGAEVC